MPRKGRFGTTWLPWTSKNIIAMKNDANLVYLMDLLDNECIAGVAAIIIAEMLAIVWNRLNSYLKCGTIGGVLEGRDAPLFLFKCIFYCFEPL